MPKPSHGKPKFDTEAIRAMEADQQQDFLLKLMGDMEGRLRELEAGNTEPFNKSLDTFPQVHGDGVIDVTQVDDQINLRLDLNKVNENIPPLPLGGGVDRYQHCNSPEIFRDRFIEAAVADTTHGFNTVIKSDETGDCYFLAERNVTEPLEDSFLISEVFEGCAACDDGSGTGSSGDEPSGGGDEGFTFFDQEVVKDIDCAKDGSGNLIVTYVNLRTKLIRIEKKTDCCCDSGDSGGDSGDVLDRWGGCCPNDDDIYLNPSVFDLGPAFDPVIELDGKCYTMVERATAGNIETAWDFVAYSQNCEDRTFCPECDTACATVPETLTIDGYSPTFFDTSGCGATDATTEPVFDGVLDHRTKTGNNYSWRPAGVATDLVNVNGHLCQKSNIFVIQTENVIDDGNNRFKFGVIADGASAIWQEPDSGDVGTNYPQCITFGPDAGSPPGCAWPSPASLTLSG